MKCDRCKNEAKAFSMSFFNTEMICIECEIKEKKHPKYAEARRIEHEECLKGNYNFEGIGF
jgi:hypothetical protein